MWLLGFSDIDPPEPGPTKAVGGSEPSRDTSGRTQATAETRVRHRGGGEDAMAKAIPWGVSILVHAAIVLLTLFVVWTQVVDSSSSIIPSVNVGESPSPSLQTSTMHSTAVNEQSKPKPKPTHQQIPSPVHLQNSIIGVTSVQGAGSPFTTKASGKFFGVSAGGSAHRIVFLIDASGAVIYAMPFILQHLQSSIRQLNASQAFTVIFFRGPKTFSQSVVELPPAGLHTATQSYKDKALAWLNTGNVVAGGQATPMPAFRQALAYRPQLIWLLATDITGTGRYQLDQKTLLRQMQQANQIKVKVNALQFLHHDPLDSLPGQTGTMRQIAKMTGGVYGFVSAQSLGLQ